MKATLFFSLFFVFSSLLPQAGLAASDLSCTLQVNYTRLSSPGPDFLGTGTLTCKNGLFISIDSSVVLAKDSLNDANIRSFQLKSLLTSISSPDQFLQLFNFYSNGATSTLFSEATSRHPQQNITVEVSSGHFEEWQILQLLYYSQIDIEQGLIPSDFY